MSELRYALPGNTLSGMPQVIVGAGAICPGTDAAWIFGQVANRLCNETLISPRGRCPELLASPLQYLDNFLLGRCGESEVQSAHSLRALRPNPSR